VCRDLARASSIDYKKVTKFSEIGTSFPKVVNAVVQVSGLSICIYCYLNIPFRLLELSPTIRRTAEHVTSQIGLRTQTSTQRALGCAKHLI
jgi:hypothetical protein